MVKECVSDLEVVAKRSVTARPTKETERKKRGGKEEEEEFITRFGSWPLVATSSSERTAHTHTLAPCRSLTLTRLKRGSQWTWARAEKGAKTGTGKSLSGRSGVEWLSVARVPPARSASLVHSRPSRNLIKIRGPSSLPECPECPACPECLPLWEDVQFKGQCRNRFSCLRLPCRCPQTNGSNGCQDGTRLANYARVRTGSEITKPQTGLVPRDCLGLPAGNSAASTHVPTQLSAFHG